MLEDLVINIIDVRLRIRVFFSPVLDGDDATLRCYEFKLADTVATVETNNVLKLMWYTLR